MPKVFYHNWSHHCCPYTLINTWSTISILSRQIIHTASPLTFLLSSHTNQFASRGQFCFCSISFFFPFCLFVTGFSLFSLFHFIHLFCFILLVDFGLHEYKRENTDSDPDLREERKRKELSERVYKAPQTRSKSGVAIAASDVYSFAIILVEVANRDDAYGVTCFPQSLFSWCYHNYCVVVAENGWTCSMCHIIYLCTHSLSQLRDLHCAAFRHYF